MEGLDMGKTNIKTSKVHFLYKILVVTACFSSFGAWFLVKADGLILSFIYLALFVLFYVLYPHYYRFEKKSKTFFFLLLIAVLGTNVHSNLNGIISNLVSILPFFLLFNLRQDLKSETLDFLLKALSYCMAVSLTAYALVIIGVPLPHTYLYVTDFYQFENYYFFLRFISFVDVLLPIPRFSFIFYEPGYTGCIISLLLYIYSYDFKKYKELYILLIALFFTLSLAGWLITIAGFFAYKFKNSKKGLGWIVVLAISFVVAGLFFKNYKGGDNIVNIAIIERLKIGERDDGLMSGYNRSSESLRDYFWTDFIHSGETLFGRQDAERFFDEDEKNTTDWMAYVIRYGWVGLILFLLFIFYPPFAFRQHRYDLFVLSGLYLLVFLQTIFLIYGYMYLTVFSLGCNEMIKRNDSI